MDVLQPIITPFFSKKLANKHRKKSVWLAWRQKIDLGFLTLWVVIELEGMPKPIVEQEVAPE